MLVIETRYIVDPALAEPHKQSHVDWVLKYMAEGVFLLAGPKREGGGGVIVANAVDANRLQAILDEDSYVKEGIVDYSVCAFNPLFKGAPFEA
ncbi:MAG: YciI family protein [Pseudomonas sp.]|uniref:YciI family protein n=1 Tax=Pseudomonas putida TaxID=303 RepID=UPI0021F89CC3|nr:YciI family protein [Pseudomonas putida]